jgi:hypothetical protein
MKMSGAFPMTREHQEIVDRLLGDFLLTCIGKNDLVVASGMLIAGVIMIKAHCRRTGHDYDEISRDAREIFDCAVELV